MDSFELRKHINRAPEDVFGLFTAFEDLPRYLPDRWQMERLDAGPLNVGSRFREVRRSWDWEERQEFEVTAWTPGKEYAVRYRFDGLTVDLRYRFSPAGEGTEVVLNGKLEGKGLDSSMVSLAAESFKSEYDFELYRFLVALESKAA